MLTTKLLKPTPRRDYIGDLQDKKSKILQEGDFHIKSWECSEEEGESKYPGMTWNRKDNC